MKLSSRGVFAATVVLFCPVIGFSVSGCGIGAAVSAVSAATNIATNGAGFTSPVVTTSTPAPVVGTDSSPTHAVGSTGTSPVDQQPIGVLQGASQQSAINALSDGAVKSLDAILKVTSTGPAQLELVVTTQPKLTDAQFWQIANAGSAAVTGASGPAAIAATLNIAQAGKFVFADADPHDPVYSYAGSLVEAANLGAGGTDNQDAFIQRFKGLVYSGQPVYTYIGIASQTNQAQVTVDSLVISGREVPNL